MAFEYICGAGLASDFSFCCQATWRILMHSFICGTLQPVTLLLTCLVQFLIESLYVVAFSEYQVDLRIPSLMNESFFVFVLYFFHVYSLRNK
jgi:hypothetical protein